MDDSAIYDMVMRETSYDTRSRSYSAVDSAIAAALRELNEEAVGGDSDPSQ